MTTLEKKIRSFSRILESRPGDELTMLALAEASFRRGFKLEALTAYQDVVSSKPVPEALLAVAEIYSAQGMPQEAYGELRHLFAIDPENVEARLLVNALQEEALPPEDLRSFMERPTTQEALEEARLRLKIQRTIYNRELQERTRNVTLEPGTVIHEYHVEEAKKKLIRVDELLRELERFWEYNETLLMLPTADPVSAETQQDFDLEASQESSADDSEHSTGSLQFDSGLRDVTPSPVGLESSTDVEPSFDLGEDATASDSGESMDQERGVLASEREVAAEDDAPESDPLALDALGSSADAIPSADGLAEGPSEDWETPSLDFGESLSVSVLAETSFESEPSEESGFERTPLSTSPLELEGAPLAIDALAPERAEDFTPDFDLSVESPLAPDLPDVGVEEISAVQETEEMPVMIDLAPIVMGEEMPDLMPHGVDGSEPYESRPQPTINDAPAIAERQEQMVVVMPSSEEGSTMILTGSETPPLGEVLDEEDSRIAEAGVETASFRSEELEAVVEVSAARRAFYQTHAESLSALTTTLARTRGVTSIYLVAREGETIDSVAKDEISEQRIGDLVKDSFEFLEAFASEPAYWVLECAGGIFVMQKLDARHVLIAVGQAGANFGALRYTMDKTRTKFEQLLAQTPD